VHTHAILTMIYGQLGQEEEVRAAARRNLELDPDFEANAWYELQLRNLPKQMAEHMAEACAKPACIFRRGAPANAPGS
jgi:hypothetical protein